MNRIFISYRSSDGKKDAARLAGDLNERFGSDQVFYDKQDLVGGSSWREAIDATLGSRPVMLVLVTPDLFGAMHPDGGRRIDREDDPIRNELLQAHRNGAVVVPLLTEGVSMPSAQLLPEVLRFFTDAHAQRLRTDDWSPDLQRVVEDLKAHGIQPVPVAVDSPSRSPDAEKKPSGLRLPMGLTIVGVLFAALLGWLVFRVDPSPEPIAQVAASAGPSAVPQADTPVAATEPGVAGYWWSIDESNRRLRVLLTVHANTIELQTDAFPVGRYPHWQAYADGVRGMGLVVNEVRYIGSGVLTQVMGVPHVEIPYQAVTGDGRGPLDTGSVVLTASTDGRELNGQLWSNGEQANTPLHLVRQP